MVASSVSSGEPDFSAAPSCGILRDNPGNKRDDLVLTDRRRKVKRRGYGTDGRVRVVGSGNDEDLLWGFSGQICGRSEWGRFRVPDIGCVWPVLRFEYSVDGRSRDRGVDQRSVSRPKMVVEWV